MKKILFFILLISIFASCSSDDETIQINSKVKEVFKTHNVNPSEMDKITYADVVNHNDNKIGIGQKNGNAWIAKFDNNGNEIYSKEYSFSWNGITKSYFMSSTIMTEQPDTSNEYNKSDCNILFAFANIGDTDFNSNNQVSNDLSDNGSFLAINMDNGNVIFQSEVIMKNSSHGLHNYIYKTYPSNNAYIIQELETDVKFSRFIAISQKGILWERETTEREKTNGVNSYSGCLFIDSERIFFRSLDSKQTCKIYNLKKSLVEKEYEYNDLPLIGDHTGDNYEVNSATYHIKGNVIYYEYDEIEKITKIDEITGKEEITYKTVNTFYYEIDTNTYKVSERKKR